MTFTNENAPDACRREANFETYSKTSSREYSAYDIEYQFRDAILSAGITTPPSQIIMDGKIHRFGKNNSCWYVAYSDGIPAGAFGDWRTSATHSWCMNGDKGSRILHQMQVEIEKAKRQREAEIRQKHEAAAKKANYIWNQSKTIIPQEDHPYLIRKRIQPHSARLYRHMLVIPIYNESDQLVNLQFISPSPDGEKRFLSGGRKRGCFHIIGNLTNKLLICEGFATGASLYEDSGQRVIVAFDAGNLLPVAKNIRELSPDSEIIICGDNDLSGVGQAKAREAALSIGGKVLIPAIPGKDWNDLIAGGCQHG